MSRATTSRRRLALWGGIALLAMAAHPALAQDGAPVAASSTLIRETNRYPVRLMLSTFDGTREFSHTQVATIGRMRQGDESWVEVDFGNGAVHIENDQRTQLGRFRNTSGVEQGMRYDYATGTLTGDPAVADFHNGYVRPLLGQGPSLGENARWTRELTLGRIGFATLRGAPFPIEFERSYFTHQGKRYVLLHYLIPSFTYTSGGSPVVMWGEGVAITDETMGEMYWNAALHRAVAQEDGGAGRPYRYAKTIAALDSAGNPVLDPREIPEAAPYVDRFYGAAATQIIPFSESPAQGKSASPLAVFAKLDTLALSVVENSANQLGELTGAYTGGSTGVEQIEPYTGPRADDAADEMGAPAFTTGDEIALPEQQPGTELIPHETTDVQQSGGGAEESAGGGGGAAEGAGGGGGSGGGTGQGSAGGGTSGGGTGQSGDGGASTAGAGVSLGQAIDVAVDLSGGLNTTVDLADKFSAITEGLNVLVSRATALSSELGTLETQIAAIKAAIAAEPSSFRPSTAFTALQNTYNAQKAELAALEATFDAAARTGVKPPAGMISYYITLSGQTMDSATELARMAATGESITVVPSARQLTLAANLQAKAAEVTRVEGALAALGAEAARLQPVIKALSETEFAALVKSFGTSPYAKVLSGVATGLNVAAVGMAAYNTSVAAGTDLSEGQDIGLTRNYGSGSSFAILGLEIAAMAGNAFSGNVSGFFFDVAAISVGSVTDIIIAAKGVQDADARAVEAQEDYYNTELRFIRSRITKFEDWIDSLEADIAQAEQDIEDIANDEAVKIAEERLAEIEARRRERERLEREAELAAEAERQRLIEEARADNERRYQEWLKRPPTPEEWAKFNADIAEAIKPDYPTAPPPTPEQLAARLREANARREAELAAIAEELARAAAEALAAAEAEAERRRELERIQEEAVAKREQEALERELWLAEARERELEVSEFDIEPVVFEPVTFEPPVWVPPVFEPPVWVPPEFDPPEASEIPWTNFDDDDWLTGTGNLAYGYEGMSGIVATDLSRWAEWLATQDVRKLERLALLAGYPNLASALADAANILALSQDDGYRRWAMNAPSCGGYVGCGPSYLERWHMKLAIVQLGDILAASRDIFSSGGFTDIGISTRDLSYLLRDHSLEDGDIVRIRIQQFGRVIYESEVNLTNAGQDFVQSLRPGVASLEIYAVNEGFSPPNTAQIRLEDVVQGESTQTYQLRTGETATLRIENNAN